MGVRHLVGCDGKNCTKLLDLTADTQLYLNPEPQNKYDRYAIQIVTKDKKLLGYVLGITVSKFLIFLSVGHLISVK